VTGQTISHYRILEKLGEGGMGVVYKAEDTKLTRTVALKFLPQHASEDEEHRTRFLREAQAAASLNHPNICTIYEIDQEHGFLAMEYVDGPTVAEKIKARPLPLEEALDIATQAAQGLGAAHESNITHRDIKPSNLMLTSKGQVKVMDFGLAQLSGRSRITQPEAVIGTPAYMSPEQARGQPADRRTDIWSLAVVLYEMLAGRTPFTGESAAAVTYRLVHEPPEPLTTLRSGLPIDLDRILGKALAKDAGFRYQHIDELAVEFRALRAAAPVPTPRRRILTARRAMLAAVLLPLAVGAFLWRSGWLGSPPPRESSIAVLPLVNLSGDSEQDYFSDGMTDILINNLGGIRALRVVSRTSVMRYKKSPKQLPEIARELNVSYILEGSVLRSGNRARITARLIDASADRQIWSRSFEPGLKDLLTAQSEVALQIAREVQVKLTPAEEKQLTSRRPVNPAAYEAYLKGRMHWNKRSAEGLRKAIEYADQAVAIDPNYASAYALLADSYPLLQTYAGASPTDVFPKAKAAAARALELDPALSEAHASLGFIKRVYDWDWTGSEFHLNRAMELNPNYSTAWHRYANFLFTVGRFEEALAAIRHAERLDPLSVPIKGIVAYVLLCMGRLDEAILTGRQALDIDPDSAATHHTIGEGYSLQGKHDAALKELQNALRLSRNNISIHAQLGVAYARAGRKADAEKVLILLLNERRSGYASAFRIAEIYLILGQAGKGYEWLNKAVDERDGDLRLILAEPQLGPFRSDPRFIAVVKRMGLK